MQLDIVMPAHNEEHRIGPTLSAYRSAWPEPGVRFVVAMDACTDGTAGVVATHAADDPRVVGVELDRLGKGGVLRAAFARCDAPLVGFVDADGATPPAELRRVADAAAEVGAAIASRHHPAAVLPARRPLGRRVASRGFAVAVRGLMRLPYSDTQCGAKVLRREVVRDVLPHLTTSDFLFDVDLLAVLRGRGHEVAEVPTIWIDREGSCVDATAHPAALVAAAAGARGAAATRALLDRAARLDRARPSYYGSALVALGRLLLQTDRLRACKGRRTVIPSVG